MRTNQNRLKYLIQRYADSKCTRYEMEELFSCISDPANNDQFNNEFLRIWNSINPGEKISSIDENELFRTIQRKIAEPAPVRRLWSAWMSSAAIILFVAAAGVFYFVLPRAKDTMKARQTFASLVTSSDHKLIKLPDGSNVLLNNNSKLDYPKDFTRTNREVVLTGEAYFDIARDPDHPFTIITGKVKTMVLGTAFNIRAYPHEQHVTVTVTRGKVKIESDDKLLGILTPNQQLSFNKQKSAATKQEVVADAAITWKEKDLVFDNVTFEEAAAEISRRYDVQINFANEKVRKCRFYASFLQEDQLEQVLAVLCDLNNASYELEDRTVTVAGQGCK